MVEGSADLVFTGGPVHTLDRARPYANAVAVRGSRIIAVGGPREVSGLIGPRTEVIGLGGRALVPGFQDAHVHPAFAGITMRRCDLSGAARLDDALAAVKAYADRHPSAEWIVGSGWAKAWFPGGVPGRAALDAVVPGRPVYLTGRDGHAAWVNTRALALAGIGADSPDPPHGRIGREAGGQPCGALFESAAALVGSLLPPVTAAERRAGLLAAQAHLHALGVTAWQDAIVGPYLGYPDPYEDYLALARDGGLTARVVGALWWDRERGAEQMPELLHRREHGRAGRFRATTVKIMQDGVTENRTAGLIDPYLDACGCRTGERGLSHIPPETLNRVVTSLDAHRFQVHFHAIGDRAVREALDAVRAARAMNGPSAARHHIAHVQVVHPADVPRFAELGVAVTMQPLWAAHEPQMDRLTIPLLGPRRAACQYPFADLARSGAILAAGSDWAVSSADPLWGMHVAVNRVLPAGAVERSGGVEPPARPFLPGQRITLDAALAAYTTGSAYVNHREHVTGSITVGRLADLVVLDRDPFAVPPDEIAATRVLQTFVGGERVHPA